MFITFTLEDRYKSFGIYGAFLTIFHFSEYFVISISNPQSLSLDSFMLTHSLQYGLAAALSWAEFFTEAYFYPGESFELLISLTYFDAVRLFIEMKQYKSFWIIGSFVCLTGEVVRKVAILTAKKGFHHVVSLFQFLALGENKFQLFVFPGSVPTS